MRVAFQGLRSKLSEYVGLARGRLARVQGWIRGSIAVSAVPPPRLPVATWGELGPELDRDREER